MRLRTTRERHPYESSRVSELDVEANELAWEVDQRVVDGAQRGCYLPGSSVAALIERAHCLSVTVRLRQLCGPGLTSRAGATPR
jgi:hypothetical protein